MRKNNIIRVIQVLLIIGALFLMYRAYTTVQEGQRIQEIASEIPMASIEQIELYQTTKHEVVNEDLVELDEQTESRLGVVEYEDPFTPSQEKDLEYAIRQANYIGTIHIPKINSTERIYIGASEAVLIAGVGIMNKTDIPGPLGGTTSVIAGHRGYQGVGKLFRDVDRLAPGDDIYITTPLYELHYQVTEQEVVKPKDVHHIPYDIDTSYITLVTCTPMYVWTDRLLVHAELISSTELNK